MTNILQRLPVACPYNLAETFLGDIVGPFVDDDRIDHIELRSPIDVLDHRAVEFVKQVDVTYSRGEDPMHFDQVWNVNWQPHGGGPFPSFSER